MSRLSTALWIALMVCVSASSSRAADIEPSTSKNCVLVIRGEIFDGDFERFAALSKVLLPGNDGESTSKDVVCLDSPGGSLREGVKFATYFYKEGVGTVVDDGQGCYSACAVMFMMGTARGDEVAFANRKIHVGGKLGFHRPFLTMPSGKTVDSGFLGQAYDAAMSSALDLIAIANSKSPWSSDPMMKADLIQKMLTHIGDDMFIIDTVDKVGRFKIELIGGTQPKLLTAEQAFYACENSLQWQDGLTEVDISYAKVGKGSGEEPRSKQLPTKEGTFAFVVEGLASGYVGEGCIIVSTNGGLVGCGLDETTGLRLGQGECTKDNYTGRTDDLNAISVYNPATRIASLRVGGGLTETTASRAGQARCYVLKEAVIVDQEPCLVFEVGESKVKERRAQITHYIWPSGSRTVLVRFDDGLEINGSATEKRETTQFGDCYSNSATLNEFCVIKQPD